MNKTHTYINTYIYIHTYTWSARNSKTVINYFIGNKKLSEIVLEVRVYRRSDMGSDHFLTSDKLRFSPKWLHLPRNTALKENILHYDIRLLIYGCIRWLYKQRMQQKLQEILVSSNIILAWKNIKIHIPTRSRRKFGKIQRSYT
jgi:hypothetical protein